jgi:hypothetical protein
VWDNTCLDRNTALQNSLNADITNLTQRIIDLDGQIAKAQADYQQAVTLESQAAHAQAMANPEMAKLHLDAQTAQKAAEIEAQAAKQSNMLYIGAGIAVLIILAVAAMFILKK